MLNALKGLSPATRSLIFPQRLIPLHALLINCGFSRETRPSYDWDGLKRGPREFVLFQYTIAGWGKLRYEQQTFTVAPGAAMLLVIPHNHRYWLPPESPFWQFIYLCLTGREILRIAKRVLGQTGPILKLTERSNLLRFAAATVRDVLRGTVASPFQASTRAYALAMALMDEFAGAVPARPRPPLIDAVVRFAQENRCRPIAVAELAAVAGCSRYHFSRVFKAWMGISPGQYLLDQRLRLSATSLQQSRRVLKEVAADCGFTDVNYFCRAFRKSFGISPGQFRRSGI